MKYIKFWLIISVALAGAFFLFEMTTASSEASAPVINPCESVISSAQGLSDELKGGMSGTENYVQKWLTFHNLIIDQGDCFTPQIVATSQAMLQKYLSH